MASLSNISVNFTANTANFTQGLKNMKGEAKATIDGIAGDFLKGELAMEGLKLAAEGIKKAFEAVIEGVAESVTHISALVDSANKIGISATKFEVFTEAVENLGISVDTVQAMFKIMNKSIEAGADGSKKQFDAFNKLGINIKELQAMAPDKQFDAIRTAIQGLTSDTEKNSVGLDLFGKQWQEVGPMVRLTSEQFQEAAENGAKTGNVLAEYDNKAIKEMHTNWNELGKLIEGGFNSVAAAFAPIFNEVSAGLLTWARQGTNFADALMLVVNIFETVGLVVGQLIDYTNVFIKLGSAGMLAIGTGILQLGEAAMTIFRYITQTFLDVTINPIIDAWNKLPFTKHIDPIVFTFADNAISETAKLKESFAEAGISFYDQSKDALSHGVAEGMMKGINAFNANITAVGERAGKSIVEEKTKQPDGMLLTQPNLNSAENEKYLKQIEATDAAIAKLKSNVSDVSAEEAYDMAIVEINKKMVALAADSGIATATIMDLEAALKQQALAQYEVTKSKHDDAAMKALGAQVKASQSLMNVDPKEKLNDQISKINAAKDAQLQWAAAGKQTTAEAIANNAKLDKSIDELQTKYTETYTAAGKAWKDFGDKFSQGLASVLTSGGNVFKNLGSMFQDVIRQMLQEWLAFQIKTAIKAGGMALWNIASNALGLAGGVSTSMSSGMNTGAGAMAGGFNYSGGTAMAGVGMAAKGGDISGPTIVGELGPELFIPKSAGTVIPNNMLGGGAAASSNFNYNIYAYDTTSVEQTIEKMRPTLQKDAIRAYQNSQMRRQ